jgi:hypothetical protein
MGFWTSLIFNYVHIDNLWLSLLWFRVYILVFGSPIVPTLQEQIRNVNPWSISYQESSCNEIQEMKILNPNQNARPWRETRTLWLIFDIFSK